MAKRRALRTSQRCLLTGEVQDKTPSLSASAKSWKHVLLTYEKSPQLVLCRNRENPYEVSISTSYQDLGYAFVAPLHEGGHDTYSSRCFNHPRPLRKG